MTVDVNPAGSGNVKVDDGAPLSTFESIYANITSVHLEAVPQPGYAFVNWSDSAAVLNSSDREIDVIVNCVKAVHANFSAMTWSPWAYDANFNGLVDKAEVVAGLRDYFKGQITKQQAIDLLRASLA